MMIAVPDNIRIETDLEFGVSDKISELMNKEGVSKVQLAKALGKRPSEVTKWLSGQHNFTLKTIAMLSSYFKQAIIEIVE